MTEKATVKKHAQTVHDRSLVVFAHCHELLPDDFARAARGGVTAKLLVTSVDGRMFAERKDWLASLETDAGFLGSTLVSLDYMHWLVSRPDSNVVIALEPSDIERAKRERQVAVILGSEGCKFLEGRLEVLRAIYRLGFRYLAPMWFFDCAVGTAQDNLSGESLTEWGRKLIAEVNRLGMILDANHFSHRSLREALELSVHPLLVSHCGALKLNPEARQLLPDELLKEIADAGGVIGVMFQSSIIKPGYEQGTMDDLMRQFEVCAELVGTDHIACGPDYVYNDPRLWGGNNPIGPMPGPITWAEGIEDASRFPALTEALLDRGFSDEDVEKILGGNLLRLFRDVRKNAPASPTGDYDGVGREIGVLTGGLTPV
jgi:membrane dipeptidase